jgi:hypothetical protein
MTIFTIVICHPMSSKKETNQIKEPLPDNLPFGEDQDL